MTEKQKQIKIAFREPYGEDSKNLVQEPYSGDYIYNREDTFKIDNIPFEAELEYITYQTGRSSLHTIWRDKKRKRNYVASFGMLHGVVLMNEIHDKKIKGTFQFYKHGSSILLEFTPKNIIN